MDVSKSSHSETPAGMLLDRRMFLGAAGAVAASAMLPVSIAHACEACVASTPDPDGLWSVDVMCGHWPPYSHPIPYGRPDVTHATAQAAAAHHMLELDYMLVA